MPLQVPASVLNALAVLDARPTLFAVRDAHDEIGRAVGNRRALPIDVQRGAWAEQVAFAFSAHDAPGGGPWGTYFQPEWSSTRSDGSLSYSPDMAELDGEVIEHWRRRAKEAKHPVLLARYADLVWDFEGPVTKAKRQRDAIDYARLAIDGYIDASRLDDGSHAHETQDALQRALRLSMSVRDVDRIDRAIRAIVEFVERTADDEKVGVYIYLFDTLLGNKKGPGLDAAQERSIIALLEDRFAAITIPGAGYDVDPYTPRDFGLRLAGYYERMGQAENRVRVVRRVAEAFERRAGIGDALSGLMFLDEARAHYLSVGLREDAERVQIVSLNLYPEAEKRLVRTEVRHEVPKEDVEASLQLMTQGTVEDSLRRIAVSFIPRQEEISSLADELARKYPMYRLFAAAPMKLGHGHIEADVGDPTGDPEGLMVHRTEQHIALQAPWMAAAFDRLIRDGLSGDDVAALVLKGPLFEQDRHPLLRRGISAHFIGDYVQAVHVLVPQIERALIMLTALTGGAVNKEHRTGRGVMQFKNLNELLTKEAWPMRSERGEDVRMYLLAALAHPKGVNIRNDVSHGLLAVSGFSRPISEILVHVVLVLSLLGPGGTDQTPEAPASAPPQQDPV